ncbi:unnamed protein product [Colias eurytheme]|nr:unnamed protein product [Colias eurytheme]
MYVIGFFKILFLLITGSYHIDVDYYDDDNNSDQNENISYIDSIERRRGYDDYNNLTFNLESTEYNNFYPHNNISDRTLLYNTENNKTIDNFPTLNITKYSGQNINIDNLNSQDKSESTSTFVPKSDIFKDYLYAYEDDKEKILRQVNISQNKDNEEIANDTTQLKLKDHSVQFYNLEPAVESDILKDIINDTQNANVWYVPEKYPCWELPLLYGELGRRKITSKIFGIYGGHLNNVIDPGYNIKGDRSFHPPFTQVMNRWCGVQPCYGDHTLCLFPDATLSKLCEKGYTVQVPTILDHIALVNTINSMRNQVASGDSDRYSHLPPAANMHQITYDYDLQKISEAWLRQCLPGPAPCSALDGNAPKLECFISPVIGCIHEWFWSGGQEIKLADVHCGRTSIKNFNSVQLLWAKTIKVGCAFGQRNNGDVRVVCNFAPGAPFILDTKLYCGIIGHNNMLMAKNNSVEADFLSSIGIFWDDVRESERKFPEFKHTNSVLSYFNVQENVKTIWGVQSLHRIYKDGWIRDHLEKRQNGTKGMIARLVTKYTFVDESGARCDTNESMYIAGESGSLCVERGRRYKNLCFDFRDPTPGYRLVAVAAPIALFTLILYDLFSGVVRQSE